MIAIESLNAIKINLIFGCMICFSNYSFSQKCVLPNGRYKVEFDKPFERSSKFEFRISNDSITIYEKDTLVQRRIDKNNDCSLVIEIKDTGEAGLTDFQKVINKQRPFYTFKKINESEYEFIYRVDMHVTINSGKFVKINTN